MSAIMAATALLIPTRHEPGSILFSIVIGGTLAGTKEAEEGRLLFDLRTIAPAEDDAVLAAVTLALQHGAGI